MTDHEDTGLELNPEDNHMDVLYSELCEEARYRHRLIHTSYYLAIIMFGVFGGAAIQFYSSNSVTNVLLATGGFGVVLFVLTFIIRLNNERRTAAYQYRGELEEAIGDSFDINSQVNDLEIRNEQTEGDENSFSIPDPMIKLENKIESCLRSLSSEINVGRISIWLLIGSVICIGVSIVGVFLILLGLP